MSPRPVPAPLCAGLFLRFGDRPAGVLARVGAGGILHTRRKGRQRDLAGVDEPDPGEMRPEGRGSMAQQRRGGGVPSFRPPDSDAIGQDGQQTRARELILQGQDLLARSRSRAAQTDVRAAPGACQSSVGARSHLALTHLLQGESELAECETKVILAVAPDNVLALTTLAQAQAAQRRWPEARATMIRALQCFYASYTAGAADGGDLAGAARMLAALGDDRRLYQLYRHCVRGVAGRWEIGR